MIILDYSDKRPIYEQIVDKIQILIVNGALEPDSRLPSVRSLAVELSINPNTIQRAYSELERAGFIYSVKGRGNFVRADEHLKEKQQAKLLEALERQLLSCQAQGITREKILHCVDNVYQAGRDSGRAAMLQEERPDSPQFYETDKSRAARSFMKQTKEPDRMKEVRND